MRTLLVVMVALTAMGVVTGSTAVCPRDRNPYLHAFLPTSAYSCTRPELQRRQNIRHGLVVYVERTLSLSSMEPKLSSMEPKLSFYMRVWALESESESKSTTTTTTTTPQTPMALVCFTHVMLLAFFVFAIMLQLLVITICLALRRRR
jgi:hypothetical protein